MSAPRGRASRRAVLALGVLAVTGGGAAGAGAVWRLQANDAGPVSPVRRSPSPTPSPTPDYLALARTKVAAYLAENGNGRITVAVRDRTSDVGLTLGKTRFQTASIVKVDILAALLLRAKQQGKELTEGDRYKAEKMITASDNASATALFNKIGGRSGLAVANRTFGLKETTPSVHWGMAMTTAADQVRLLTALTDEAGPLRASDRAYLFDLMSQVEETQDWGVPAAAGPDATATYVKNGWDNISADGGLWQVNTIGRLVEPGRDWLVAVLSGHHETQQAGIKMVEAVARYTLRELRSIPR
ncbi:serine hydrolase [Asanoa sp. NPDC049518]|uniref:serine hydrolase n=1 Tax=unclassified Asanoa TaxID=2685164 RepID=UPI003421E625